MPENLLSSPPLLLPFLKVNWTRDERQERDPGPSIASKLKETTKRWLREGRLRRLLLQHLGNFGRMLRENIG